MPRISGGGIERAQGPTERVSKIALIRSGNYTRAETAVRRGVEAGIRAEEAQANGDSIGARALVNEASARLAESKGEVAHAENLAAKEAKYGTSREQL